MKAKVKSNVAVFKDFRRKAFRTGELYYFNVTAVSEVNGREVEKCIGEDTRNTYKTPYYNDEMNRLAEGIAKKLSNPSSRRRDLKEDLAYFTQPWSKTVAKLVLVISDDASAFAGKGGRKRISESRSADACSNTKSTAHCQE
ncbi:hypothetical protein Ciccas_014286 [Cichlidogyrus casuarinus]|uniref:Uncharacterized protein n=1 Tax=Cichlidogyrus casuarinus TaxID=1844966 RepID=A0ABD2PK68_9PLAT